MKLPKAGRVGAGLWDPGRPSEEVLSACPPQPLESPSQATHPSEGFPFLSPVSVLSRAPKGRRVLLRAERGPAETTPAPSSPQGSGGVSPCPPPLLVASPVSHLPWVSHIAICAVICGVQAV